MLVCPSVCLLVHLPACWSRSCTGGGVVLVDARVIKLGRDVATIEVQLKHGSSGQLVATVSDLCRAPCHPHHELCTD